MFCPHCGAPSKEAWRYCVSCGAELREPSEADAAEAEEQGQTKGFARRLIGSDRRERLMTAGTVLALLVAGIGVLVLLLGGGGDRERYLEDLDAVCAENSKALSLIHGELGPDPDNAELTSYGAAGAEIVSDWRAEVRALQEPAELETEALELDSALADLELGLQTLARDRADQSVARQIDYGRSGLERSIGQLGLSTCEPPSVPSQG